MTHTFTDVGLLLVTSYVSRECSCMTSFKEGLVQGHRQTMTERQRNTYTEASTDWHLQTTTHLGLVTIWLTPAMDKRFFIFRTPALALPMGLWLQVRSWSTSVAFSVRNSQLAFLIWMGSNSSCGACDDACMLNYPIYGKNNEMADIGKLEDLGHYSLSVSL